MPSLGLGLVSPGPAKASTPTNQNLGHHWQIQGKQFVEVEVEVAEAGGGGGGGGGRPQTQTQPSPRFLAGINYEGYTDLGWKMWETTYFDPKLIEKDFAIAELSGYNTIRIFVQEALARDILAGDFTKLDAVVAIANTHHIKLLITLADYGEGFLTNLLKVDRLISAHLRESSAVLGYDLKNEPGFGDLAGIIYPTTAVNGQITSAQQIAVQTGGGSSLIDRYGERMSAAQVQAWRMTPQGLKIINSELDNRRAYLVANVYTYWEEYKHEADEWASQQNQQGQFASLMQPYTDSKQGQITDLLPLVKQLAPKTKTAGYNFDVATATAVPQTLEPEPVTGLAYSTAGSLGITQGKSQSQSEKWQPLLEIMDQTVAEWTRLRKQALRSGDPQALITTGFNDLHLAALPKAAGELDFLSPHIYGETAGLAPLMVNLSTLAQLFSDKPIVLEEFGMSGVQWPNLPVAEEITASYEAVVWLWLVQNNFAGGYKWLLNNNPSQPNWMEANFGLLGDTRQPKQNLVAARAVLEMARTERTDPSPSSFLGFNHLSLGLDGRTLSYNWQAQVADSNSGDTLFYFFANETLWRSEAEVAAAAGSSGNNSSSSNNSSPVLPWRMLVIGQSQSPWSLKVHLPRPAPPAETNQSERGREKITVSVELQTTNHTGVWLTPNTAWPGWTKLGTGLPPKPKPQEEQEGKTGPLIAAVASKSNIGVKLVIQADPLKATRTEAAQSVRVTRGGGANWISSDGYRSLATFELDPSPTELPR